MALATGHAELALTAGLLLVLGLGGAVLAAATGLLDWLEMIPGTPRRARVTRHLLVQVAAASVFALALLLRGGAIGSMAPPAGVLASVVGTFLLLAGNHLGGLLVYRDGMRVRMRRDG